MFRLFYQFFSLSEIDFGAYVEWNNFCAPQINEWSQNPLPSNQPVNEFLHDYYLHISTLQQPCETRIIIPLSQTGRINYLSWSSSK